MSDVTRPQDDPKPGRTPVAPLVIADINDRVAAGEAKYGTVLKSGNGRDALVDAYQEALDLVMYLRQAIVERAEKELDQTRAAMLQQAAIHEDTVRGVGATPARQTAREFIAAHPGLYARPGRFIPVDGPPVPDTVMLAPETILQEAQRLVHGDRGEAYGHPIFDMTRTADMLTGLLRDKLRPGVRLEAEDIGQAMICVKMSRQRNKVKRDNMTDTAGYAETLSMIQQWREANHGLDPRDAF
jgi:hypothetical protein